MRGGELAGVVESSTTATTLIAALSLSLSLSL